MAARTKGAASGTEKVVVNEVRLAGRVSVDPERRVLPSGDILWSLRLVAAREPGGERSRQPVDTLECAVWAAMVQRSVATRRAGDQVEVRRAKIIRRSAT